MYRSNVFVVAVFFLEPVFGVSASSQIVCKIFFGVCYSSESGAERDFVGVGNFLKGFLLHYSFDEYLSIGVNHFVESLFYDKSQVDDFAFFFCQVKDFTY